MTRKVFGLLAAAVFLYVAFVTGLFVFQRSMVFVPDRSTPDLALAGAPDMAIIETRTADGLVLHGWFRPLPEDSTKPVLVYFHGNSGNIENRGSAVLPWIEDGYGVLLAEYRGYGANPGKPTEQGLYEDARAWLEWLATKGISADRVVVYGESLGTGVAVQMALEHPQLKAIALQSGYTSLPDVARLSYPYVPVGWLMRDRFENLEKIAQMKVPVLILHGARDPLIPVAQAMQLYDAAAEPKRIVVFPEGHHNDLPLNDRKASLDLFLTSLPSEQVEEDVP